MPTVPPTISPLPTPPSRDDSTNFTTRADAFLGALPTLQSETNATATNVYNNAVEVSTNATTVQSNTTLAVNSATAASNSAGAAIWVSGTTYAIGAVRWSPANGKIYRRITSGGGTTDPSLDPTNWVNVSDWNGGIVVNELGADVDFRIESDTNANAFFLDGANGNIGIGTGTPLTALNISGDTNQTFAGTGSITGNVLDITAVTTGSLSVGDRIYWSGIDYNTYITALGTGTGGTGTYTLNNSQTYASGNVYAFPARINTLRFTDTDGGSTTGQGIGGIEFWSSDASTPGAGVKGYLAVVSENNNPDGAMLFGTADNVASTQAVERMRITSAGNVGIGTSSPSYRLSVEQSASTAIGANIRNVNTGASAYAGIYFGGTASATDVFIGAVGDSNTNFGGGRSALFGTNTTTPIVFTTNSTEKMRLTSAGELLLGGTTALVTGQGVVTVERLNTNPTINLYRNDTSATTNNSFGLIGFWGNDTTSNTPTSLAYVNAVASGDHAAGDNPTDLVFGTTPDGSETVAEAGRITQAGSYVLKGGTTTAAAGVGIIFPATQVASANANSLDDYEEGTWTPTYTTSGTDFSAVTYDGITVGRYTKIGNKVFIEGRIRTDAITVGAASGDVRIGGLPFTVNSGQPVGCFSTGYAASFAGDVPTVLECVPNTITAALYYRTAANTDALALAIADLGTGANANWLDFSGFYTV